MVRGGYGQITDALAARLDVRRNSPVTAISAGENAIKVKLESGAAPSSLFLPIECRTFAYCKVHFS